MWLDESTALTIACYAAGASFCAMGLVWILRAWRDYQERKRDERLQRRIMARVTAIAEQKRKAHARHPVSTWPTDRGAA